MCRKRVSAGRMCAQSARNSSGRVRLPLPVRDERSILTPRTKRFRDIRPRKIAGEQQMNDQGFGRRDFLKGAVTGAAAATATVHLPQGAQAKEDAALPPAAGYSFL